MKVIVTGSTGRLGSALTDAFISAGHDVIPVDVRPPEVATTIPTRVIDLSQIDGLHDLMRGADVICHLGNLPGTQHSGRSKGFINNAAVNYNVFLAATEAGVRRIVYGSSVQAYGCFGHTSEHGPGVIVPPRYLPLDEDHPLHAADAYPLSKANGEWIAASFCRGIADLTVWSLRYTGVQFLPLPQPNPRDGLPAPPTMILGSMATWVHIDDAIRATIMACSTDRPGHNPLNIVAPTGRRPWSEDVLVTAYGALP